MPKTVSKSKSAVKSKAPASKAAKKTAKPVKAKAEKPAAKGGLKSLVKAVGKVLLPKKAAAPIAKTEKPVKTAAAAPAAKVVAKPAKDAKAKKPKKAAKKEDELDLGDDLVGDEIGAEDIPDLSEFDELEIEEEDTDEEVEALSNEGARTPSDEIYLTDAEGRRYCRVRDCDQISAVEGYCRFHYLQLWKRIQVRRKILQDGKLERYVEELTARYPDKFLEMIRKDLRAEKDFLAVIAELEIDESAVDNEFEDEAQSFIDEVRGMAETPSSMSDDDEF